MEHRRTAGMVDCCRPISLTRKTAPSLMLKSSGLLLRNGTVIDTAKSTDQFMTPLGRSRDKRDLGAFDVPTLGAPAREGQVLLEKGLET